MSDLQIRAEGAGTYVLTGALTFESVPGVLEQAHDLFAAGKSLAIDLKGITRTDSAGLALLLEWMRVARASGTEIRFRHLPQQMLAMASASRLDKLLPVD